MAAVSSAVAGFVGQHGAQFAAELWGFLHSGLSVAAYDAAVFGEPGAREGDAAAADDGGGADEWRGGSGDEGGAGGEW